MRKTKDDQLACSFSEAQKVIDAHRPKARFTTKLYFWLFILLTILTVFLFWTGRGKGMNINILAGIIAMLLALFFAMVCFIRFIRSRSIAGGLFLTTCISTGVFLGASQLIPVIVPPTAGAFSSVPDAGDNSLQLIVILAQVGLFAIWFMFLLFTIYLHVRPVKRIDRYLQNIVDGEHVKKFRVGKAKQYRGIEEKLTHIAARTLHDSSLSTDVIDSENR